MGSFQFFQLKEKYPRFIYEKFAWQVQKRGLKITFSFRIESRKKPDLIFKPKVIISDVKNAHIKRVGERVLNNLVFHLGLIEMLSYWKATSSPEIIIKPGCLNKEQINWWQKVIERGMAQFFYENKINFFKINLKSQTEKDARLMKVYEKKLAEEKVLLPIGGGKDSLVALELLKSQRGESLLSKENIQCFVLNPTPITKKIREIWHCKKMIIVKRKIEKNLLVLNKKGYLNGHTPFSAYLAFLSVLAAVLFDFKYIAFANERSANEGNFKYLGKTVNHQWSKSYEFEKMFRNYSQKYLAREVEYFSFLRPLYEIQIAKIFSNFPQYLNVFSSCNRSLKKNIPSFRGKWCGQCPKCLFVFAILYPFLGEKKMIKIFGKNLFENKKLLPLMQQLIGERGRKPFECVGTKKETLAAFYLAWQSYQEQSLFPLPELIKYFEKKVLPQHPDLKRKAKRILRAWDKNNFLPKKFEKILKSSLKE